MALAKAMASQTWPSLLSPSPTMRNTWELRPFSLSPRAMPQARDVPCPREPVVMSTPGVLFRSQWLGRRVPGRFRVFSSS